MTCATCKHCISISHDITSPGGFNQVAVEFRHCMVHDLPVELDDYCDDHSEKAP